MDGGTGVLATREARTASSAVLRALVSLKPAMLAVGYGGLLSVAWLAGFESAVWWVVVVLGFQAAGLATMVFGISVFRGHEEFGTEAVFLVAQRLLFGLLVAAVLVGGGGVLGVSGAGAISYAVVAVWVFALLGRRHGIRARFDAPALRAHGGALLRSIGPLMLADALAQAQMRSGQVILPFTSGMGEVGLYTVARRLVEGLNLLPSTFAMALFPRLVAAWRDERALLPRRLQVGLRFAGSVAAVTLLGGLVWAGELVRTLFGFGYAGAGPVLRVLAGDLAVMSVNAVLVLAMVAVGRERAYAIALAAASATSVAGNLLLTPRLGAMGAAWAALAGDGVLCIACLLVLLRVVSGFVPLREWTTLAVAGGAALALLFGVKEVSPPAAAVLTVLIVVVGFQIASPIGVREILALRIREPLDRTEA
jgi:PST family polysaccharide transporter